MAGTLNEDDPEPQSEFDFANLLSALAFGISLEEVAKFLINNIVERESKFFSGFGAAMTCVHEARNTTKDWIDRRFAGATYDHGKVSWQLIDGGRAYRIVVQKASNSPQARVAPAQITEPVRR